MARRIRWQLLIAALSSLLIVALMGGLAVSRTAVARPSSGGDYVEAVLGAPQQLNPLLNDPLADPVGAELAALMFEGLMRPGQGGIPEPLLAARLPELSADGLVYTFTLRPNLRWHDGVALTADDVVFTLRTLKRPEFTGSRALAALWQGVLVDKIDEQRVQFTLTAPYGPFPAATTVPILPAHLLSDVPLADWPTAPFSRNPVGSGPYRLLSLDGQSARLVANREYHSSPPLIDQLDLRFVRDTDDALAALESGEVQAFGYSLTREPNQLALPPETTTYNTPLDSYSVLTFNLRRAPLDDVDVRRALARGLDKQQLVDSVLSGRAAQLDTPILPGWWAFSPAASWYAPDAARAGDTLGELGYTPGDDGVRARNGRPLAFTLICDGAADRLAVAQEIVRQWATIGVAVSVEQLDGPVLEQRLRDHAFDLALHGWTRLGPDPDVFELWHSSQAADGANYAGLDDPQIDEALADGRAASDYAARARSYAVFQRRWIELAPSITLYQPLYSYVARSSVGLPDFQQPGGPALLFGPADRFRAVGRWYVNSEREIRGDLRGPR